MLLLRVLFTVLATATARGPIQTRTLHVYAAIVRATIVVRRRTRGIVTTIQTTNITTVHVLTRVQMALLCGAMQLVAIAAVLQFRGRVRWPESVLVSLTAVVRVVVVVSFASARTRSVGSRSPVAVHVRLQ